MTVVRQQIVAECAWGVKNTTNIHYAQTRPTPNQRWKSHTLPITTDCSGSTEAIFFTSGAPDPSGLGYNGQGNTATLYANATHLRIADLVAGDFIVCFKGTETEHVYIVVARLPSGDLKLFTHGQESTPAYENYSQVRGYWDSVGHMAGCRTLPLIYQLEYTWAVLNANRVLDHTKHPARWAVRHPRSFRKYDWVRFRKDVL